MTQQRQWFCFGPDRAFAYKTQTGRIITFESTPNGWNLTVELEAPHDANRKLTRNHGHYDDRATLRADGEIRTHDGRLPDANKC